MNEVKRRNTWQREAVRNSLNHTDGFVSAQALHANLRDAGQVLGIATVYRALADLAAAGDADTYVSDDGEQLYRACSQEHHHHLICRECGKTVEISASPVEQWAREVATEHGFIQPTHVVDIFGVCADCAR